MNILHLHTELNLACGITKTIFLLSKGANSKFSNFIITLDGDAIDRFLANDIKVHTFKHKRNSFLGTVSIFYKLILFIRKYNISILHSHHRYFDLIAYLLSKIVKVKTLTSVQSKVTGKKLFSYKADHLIACSNSIKNHLIDYFNIDIKKISVIHNFVDIEEINIANDRKELKEKIIGSLSVFVIGYIGRINIAEKGIDILVDAYYKLSLQLNNIVLLMVGSGTDVIYVTDFAKSKNIKIILSGAQENVYPFIDIMDLVIMPSRVEPFGIAAIEAGVMKKAVIASNVDGLKEIIDNGISGVLVSELTSESFTKDIKRLINDDEIRNQLGEMLHIKVINEFNSTVYIPKYNLIYERISKD